MLEFLVAVICALIAVAITLIVIGGVRLASNRKRLPSVVFIVAGAFLMFWGVGSAVKTYIGYENGSLGNMWNN